VITKVPKLSPKFVQTIQNAFGDDGKRWLGSFPSLLEEAARLWGLMDIQPVPNLSYNFVAFAHLNMESNVGRRWLQSQETLHSTQVILKLGVPNRELASEIAALRCYNGRGACRLLDANAEKGMLLLERLLPGRMLSTLEDDERATHIAADVMRELWRPVPENKAEFILLEDWFDGFNSLRRRFDGGTGPLPEKLVETAESLSQEFLIENKDETLLHGDFHHYNVLASERGWLAIDPKGVIGPRGYEVGPFLINPIDHFLNGNNPGAQTERRIAILSEKLGMERVRIRSWAICHAILSAWWSIEDNDPGWGDYSVRCAELFTEV
jgi:streptomycin 6-kinase